MEVAVIFSTNHRAVSDGTCVLNKTGGRTDVMLSGICFSFFFFLSFHMSLFFFPSSPSVGCYMDFFVVAVLFKIFFFLAANHSEGTVEKGSSDTLSLSMDGFL